MLPTASHTPSASTPALAGSMPGAQISVFSDMQMHMEKQSFLDQMIDQYHVINVEINDKFDAEHLLRLVEFILKSSVHFVDKELLGKGVEEGFEVPQLLKEARNFEGDNKVPSSHVINRIRCQMTCKAVGAEDAEKALSAMFDSVKSYSWEKKLVLMLAAFAILYGDFWVLASTKGPHSLSVTTLRGFGAFDLRSKHRDYVKNLNELAKQLLVLTADLIELQRYTMEYLAKQVPELCAACNRIPVWICQTVIAIVLVSAKFCSFTDFEERHWTWELSQLPNKVTNIASQVKQHLNNCQIQIEEMKLYNKFAKRIEYPLDIVQLLTTFFKPFKPEDPPLFSGSTKASVTFEYFRRKKVYLLISSWKIPENDLKALLNIYHDHKFQQKQPTEDGTIMIGSTTPEKGHDILWVPALDSPLSCTESVDKLRARMPWIVAKNASVVHESALRYFKENWHFGREPILVSLNHSGWVECLNAMPMICLWGISSFPFTEQVIPRLLGSKSNAWIEIIIVPIIPKPLNWVKDDKYILFYGGQQNTVSLQPEIERKITDAIGTSFTMVGLDSLELVDQFLSRLENRLYVKMKILPLLRDGSVSDPLGDLEVHQMLQTFTAHEMGGFAILTRGYEVLTVALFTTARKVLGEHDKWLQTVSKQTSTVHSNFEEIFIKRCEEIDGLRGCRHYHVPTLDGLTPRYLRCPVCFQRMKSGHKFQCCHDN